MKFNRTSAHYYIEEKINQIFLNLVDEMYEMGPGLGTILVNRVINEAVAIGLVVFKEPEQVGTFDERKRLNEQLKDKWCLTYNAGETGAEWSDGFILVADSKDDAVKRFEKSHYYKSHPQYQDGYMLLTHAFKPDADFILRPTPYLSKIWIDLDNARHEKIEKENEAFRKNPQKELARVITKVQGTFDKMIDPEGFS